MALALTPPAPAANGGTGATSLTGHVKGDITGLGTMSTQAANNVSITGGSIDSVSIDNVTLDGGRF